MEVHWSCLKNTEKSVARHQTSLDSMSAAWHGKLINQFGSLDQAILRRNDNGRRQDGQFANIAQYLQQWLAC